MAELASSPLMVQPGRLRPMLFSLLFAALVSFGCGEPDPETLLEEASAELGDALAELASADAGVETIRSAMRELEEDLADAERVRREAAKHVEEADAQLAKVADDDTVFRTLQRRLLEDADLADSAVSATVANSVATLSGDVPSVESQQRAIEIATQSPGVRRVVSQLRVANGEIPAAQ